MSELARSRPVEDPERLDRFRAVIATAAGDASSRARLQRIASALDDLIVAEVRYYYRSRRWHALVSTVCRVSAWVAGTVGLLLRFRLQWLRLETSGKPDDDVVGEAFALFDRLAEDAATVIAAETTQWSSALQRAIDSYGVAAGPAGRRH